LFLTYFVFSFADLKCELRTRGIPAINQVGRGLGGELLASINTRLAIALWAPTGRLP
jgi:hypothetical protein